MPCLLPALSQERATGRIELAVRVPADAPADQRAAAALAALEQQGFRATSSELLHLIGRLAAVSRAGVAGARLCPLVAACDAPLQLPH